MAKTEQKQENTEKQYGNYNSKVEELNTSKAMYGEALKQIGVEYKAREEREKALKELRIENLKEILKLEAEQAMELEKEKARVARYNAENLTKSLKEDLGKWWNENVTKKIESGEWTGKLTSKLDSVISDYVSQQEKIAAHLVGTNSSLESITGTINGALGGSTITKTSEVYEKVSSLLQQGITGNVEQRAFLQTLGDQFAMYFAKGGSLDTTIRILRADITANRASLEYSLTEFLNNSYQNSQYIADVMGNVSSALTQSQALFSSTTEALNYEATVQGWLGALYSLGFTQETTTSLANAINKLGSGDITGLGSDGISNLLLMGAARANVPYADILNNGITSDNVNQLMSGVVSYLQEINGYGSNVVKSQLSNIFGVQISDIVNSSRMTGMSGNISTSSSTFLNAANDMVPFAAGLKNVLDNIMTTWGTGVASNKTGYIAYEIEKMVAKSGIGDIFNNIGSTLGGLKGLPATLFGTALNNAPLISLIGSGAFGAITSGLSNVFGSGSSAYSIFNALGGGNNLGTTVKVSGSGTSTGMYISTSTDDMLSGSSQNFSNSGLVDTTEISSDEPEQWELDVSSIKTDVYEIYTLLNNHLNSIDEGIATIANVYNFATGGASGLLAGLTN